MVAGHFPVTVVQTIDEGTAPRVQHMCRAPFPEDTEKLANRRGLVGKVRKGRVTDNLVHIPVNERNAFGRGVKGKGSGIPFGNAHKHGGGRIQGDKTSLMAHKLPQKGQQNALPAPKEVMLCEPVPGWSSACST